MKLRKFSFLRPLRRLRKRTAVRKRASVMDLTCYIRDIVDFPKPGIIFKDITPLLSEPRAFQYAIDKFVEHYRTEKVDVIAAAEARGFLFAAPLALRMSKPLVPLRKPGKLPHQTHSLRYDLEYGSAELQLHVDAVTPGARVLLVDDVLATGGTMKASCDLIRKAGGEVVGCAFLIDLTFLGGRDKLRPYEVFSLISY
jgi:adenine phosphoribosyltransferase